MSDNLFLILKSISGDVVLSQGGYGFQSAIDDFENANYINVVTYSIKPFEDSELLGIIKKIPHSVPVNIVLNIPKKSYGSPDASQRV